MNTLHWSFIMPSNNNTVIAFGYRYLLVWPPHFCSVRYFSLHLSSSSSLYPLLSLSGLGPDPCGVLHWSLQPSVPCLNRHFITTLTRLKWAMIIAVMNAISAIAYRSLKKSGLQRGNISYITFHISYITSLNKTVSQKISSLISHHDTGFPVWRILFSSWEPQLCEILRDSTTIKLTWFDWFDTAARGNLIGFRVAFEELQYRFLLLSRPQQSQVCALLFVNSIFYFFNVLFYYCEVIYEMFHILNCWFEIK